MVLVAGCVANLRDDALFIKGSDTMKGLVEAWGVDYSKRSSGTRIAFGGGGSGVGIYAMLNGLVDLCASSRPLTPKEQRVARRKGLEVTEIPVATDGIAVIVHPTNPVPKLSLSQLKAIFTGTSTRWHKIGGSDLPIAVLSRERLSGTHHFFRRRALDGEPYTRAARQVSSSAAVVDGVARDPAAIGYVGLGYARDGAARVRVVPLVGGSTTTPSSPSPASVASGAYPLVRPLYLYLATQPTGAVARFVAYVRGPRGQGIVADAGFVTVTPRDAGPPLGASSARGAGAPD